jgi:hypothetical protein
MKPRVQYNCRLRNHNLSAHRLGAQDNYELISNQYAFLVTCHDCGFKWKEIWTRSTWFLGNSSMITQDPILISP